MQNSSKTVVDKMFAAFATGNVDAILETVSEDTVWIYHGTQVIPKGEYRGKEGARKFLAGILNGTEIIKFEPEEFIVQNNKVVVLGNEHQKVKKTGTQLKQKWVQVYTVENNLITRMEEFATSEVVN
jgi:uncharacterized protein